MIFIKLFSKFNPCISFVYVSYAGEHRESHTWVDEKIHLEDYRDSLKLYLVDFSFMLMPFWGDRLGLRGHEFYALSEVAFFFVYANKREDLW